jgi:fatty-acyl-CoA synthase
VLQFLRHRGCGKPHQPVPLRLHQRAFAEPRIAERPAWPKQYYIVDSIPVTGVGKIFKPALRADAVQRVVKQAVAAAIGSEDARISVAPGGNRGMSVTVTVPFRDIGQRTAIQNALNGYIFAYDIAEA